MSREEGTRNEIKRKGKRTEKERKGKRRKGQERKGRNVKQNKEVLLVSMKGGWMNVFIHRVHAAMKHHRPEFVDGQLDPPAHPKSAVSASHPGAAQAVTAGEHAPQHRQHEQHDSKRTKCQVIQPY